ncbi:MAG: ATP-binding protein [Sedimenticola sp.]
MSIKKRIFFALILLSLLPLALISLLTAFIGEEALKQIIARHYTAITQEKADAITRILDDRINETRLLAQHPAVVAAVQNANRQYIDQDPDELMAAILAHDKAWISNKGDTDKAREVAAHTLSSTLKAIQQRRPEEYGEMFVTDRLGATVAMTKTLSDYYQADEYWWKSGSKLGDQGAFFDDRGYDETVKSIVVGATVPIRDDSGVIGVFKINYKVKSILDIITRKNADSEEIIGLARSFGELIVSSRPEDKMALVQHEEEMKAMPAGGWWEDRHGEAGFLGAHAPVGHSFYARVTKGALKGVSGETSREISWYVISELDERIAFESLDILRRTALGLAVGALLLAALLGVLLTRSITSPLERLGRGAKSIGSGALDHRINLHQKDEFGNLAETFDNMAKRLQETLASRDDLNREIDERKRAEEESNRLRNYLNDVINAMPSIMVGVDSAGHVVHWNHQAAEHTGVSQEEAIGKRIDELLPLIPEAIDNIQWAEDIGVPVILEKQPYKRGSETLFAEITIYPLTAAGIEGSMVRIDDVTKRVRMEDMMVQTEKMLSVGGLAAGMAHEINNPLGGMLQGLQNIRRRLSPELEKNKQCASEHGIDLDQLQHYLEKREIFRLMESMSQSGDRAGDIVNNMLRFSRKSEEGFEKVDLVDLIDRTLELAAVDYDMKKKYDFRSIEIARDYEADLPPLLCNPGEIQQVILNLLRNSAQAIYEHPEKHAAAKIDIRAWKEDERMLIQVEDNGPGMDKEICNRVFEPFYTTKPPGQGTGLGLSVSYYIVHDEHKGDMQVESTPGTGTRFTIKLPVDTTDSA